MATLLQELAPILARLGGDIGGLLDVLNPTAERMRADVAAFADQVDPDRCRPEFLPQLLRQVGWTYPMTLTERQQRGLVRAAVAIYAQKGTRTGLINALRVVLGLTAEVLVYATDGWELGVGELGSDTYLAADLAGEDATGFSVLFPRALTDQERDAATAIIDFMKPQFSTYTIQEVAP